jgi:peptidoglycan/LPS O-acetylase OafA/YrhL
VLRRIGQVSYGGYLYHLPIIGVATPVRDRLHAFGTASVLHMAVAHVAWTALVLSTTLIAAVASYRWIETPFLELKGRFSGTPARAEDHPLASTETATVR